MEEGTSVATERPSSSIAPPIPESINISDAIWASLNLDEASLEDENNLPKIEVEPLLPLLNTKREEAEESWNEAISLSIESYNKEAIHLDTLVNFQKETNKTLDDAIQQLESLSKTLTETEESVNKLQFQNNESLENSKSTDIALLHLSGFIDQMFIEPKLIRHIIDGKIGDKQYSYYLSLLSKKVALFEMNDLKSCQSYNEIKHIIDKLVLTAITKVRSFLILKIDLLKRPNTNVNIVKENVLLPHRTLVEFVEQHAALVFREIKNMYVETMSKTYYVLFKKYIAGLLTMKQILPSEYGDTLVGSLSSSSIMSNDRLSSLWGGGSNSNISINRRDTSRSNNSMNSNNQINARSAGVNQFAIGDRLNVLRDVEGPAIVLATAVDNNERFYYEQIHRSLGKMLSETCASEHIFCDKFFGEGGGRMFNIFFKRIVGFLLEEIKQHTSVTRDTLGVLLALKVNEAQRSSMQMRNIQDLSDYFIQVDIILKPKFKKLFDENIQSLSDSSSHFNSNSSNKYQQQIDCNPHIITRRFAEFITSLLLIAKFGTPDDSIMEGLRRLRSEFNGFLNAYAKLFTRPKPRYVFLVNNIDFVLSILKQKTITNTDDYRFFSEMNDVHIAAYVEHEVADHFPDIISFVRQYERTMKVIAAHPGNRGTQRHAGEERVKAVLRQFASNWRLGVQHMQDGVLREFPNYELGADLIRSLFSRLLAYHKRCDAAIHATYPNLIDDIVPSSEIVQELRQRASKV